MAPPALWSFVDARDAAADGASPFDGATDAVRRLVSFRSGELAPPSLAHMVRQIDAGHAALFQLEGLPRADVQVLIQLLAGQPGAALFAQRLHAATDGNPLFVLETIRLLFERELLVADPGGGWRTPFDAITSDYTELPVPASARETVIARVRALGEGAARLLEAASLAGDAFDLPQLAGTAALDDADSVAALEHAQAAQILRSGPDGEYRFTHDLFRQCLADSLSPARRALVHARLARNLASTRGLPGRIADHFEKAHLDRDAAPWFVRAGDAAAQVFDFDTALAHYQRALRLGLDSVSPPMQTPPPVPPAASASAVARFAYAANAADGTISIYAVDSQSGQLRANGYVDAGSHARAVAVDPTHTVVYALVNAGVYVARLNPETGALTPIAGSPFATGQVPMAIAVDPTARYVYVANRDSDDISAYAIDAAGGALVPVAGSPFAAGDAPKSITVDPTGKFVYIANKESDNVSAFRIDPATGALAQVAGSPFASGIEPNSIAVNPSGTFAFVANGGELVDTGTISAYAIDAATVALTPVAGNPVATEPGISSIAVDPSGRFVYVISGETVAAYAIDATTGALTQLADSPYGVDLRLAAEGQVGQQGLLAVDPRGKIVYVTASTGETTEALQINPTTGALTPVPGTPFEAGLIVTSIAVHPSGRFAYFGLGGAFANAIYKIDSTFAVDPATFTVHVVTGALEFLGITPPSGSVTISLAVDATGSALATGGAGGVRLTHDFSGKFVYVANFSSNNISAFAVNTADGSLSAVPGSPFAAGSGPRSIAVSGRVQ